MGLANNRLSGTTIGNSIVLTIQLSAGSIPNSVCLLTNLQNLHVTDGGSNPAVVCAPYCVSSITSANLFVPSTVCVYPQDMGLCGLIAATNIHAVVPQWYCTSLGVPATTPCVSAWSHISCVGINIVYFSFNNGLTGT